MWLVQDILWLSILLLLSLVKHWVEKIQENHVKFNGKANGTQGAKDFISNSKVRAMVSASVSWYPRKTEKRPSFKLFSWKTVSSLVNCVQTVPVSVCFVFLAANLSGLKGSSAEHILKLRIVQDPGKKNTQARQEVYLNLSRTQISFRRRLTQTSGFEIMAVHGRWCTFFTNNNFWKDARVRAYILTSDATA